MPIKFYLYSHPTKKGECQIRVSIMIGGFRLMNTIGNGYAIHPDKWDLEKQRVKKGASNSRSVTYAEINNRISTIASTFEALEADVVGGKTIQDDTLKKIFKEQFSKVPVKETKKEIVEVFDETLFGYFDKFIAQQKKINNWHRKTENKFTVIRKQLFAFNPNLKYEDITKEMLSNYCKHLESNYNLVNSTIKKHILHLRQFFRWSIEEQIIVSSPIINYLPKLDTAQKPIIYLEWDELMTLYNYQFKENDAHLERVRDCFVFQCFTGLRYSDLYNLRRSDIRGNSIFVTTIKTSDSLEIQLNDYSVAILDKYSKEEYPNNKALPVISNQKMNDALKIICKTVGIDTPIRTTIYQGTERKEVIKPKYELIGTHCGRRTFVCNALMLGIAPDIVMKWTGHSDYKAMKPYIEISNKAKAEAMKLFNK